jgi:hypothetical protein
MLNIPVEYDKDTLYAKFKDISRQFPASLLGVCWYLPDSSGG